MSQFHGIQKIVSGGQTGVDRAALDVALELGIPHGGWCPKGRLSEDGQVPAKYNLQEMRSSDYAQRTRQNVIDSDGTLILYRERLSGGTLLTHRIAKDLGKPLMRVRLDRKKELQPTVDWILSESIQVLNVAGPRGSAYPDLETETSRWLLHLLQYENLLPQPEADSD
ncbi:MAG: putative molybdenum carrier protein [Planctomycetota bacterium]